MITQYGSLRRSLTKCEFEVKMLLGILLQSKGVINVQNSNYVKPGGGGGSSYRWFYTFFKFSKFCTIAYIRKKKISFKKLCLRDNVQTDSDQATYANLCSNQSEAKPQTTLSTAVRTWSRTSFFLLFVFCFLHLSLLLVRQRQLPHTKHTWSLISTLKLSLSSACLWVSAKGKWWQLTFFFLNNKSG